MHFQTEDWSRVHQDTSMDDERINTNLNLYDCLQAFSCRELLDENNTWFCPVCRLIIWIFRCSVFEAQYFLVFPGVQGVLLFSWYWPVLKELWCTFSWFSPVLNELYYFPGIDRRSYDVFFLVLTGVQRVILFSWYLPVLKELWCTFSGSHRCSTSYTISRFCPVFKVVIIIPGSIECSRSNNSSWFYPVFKGSAGDNPPGGMGINRI